jgi:hypothetical protein
MCKHVFSLYVETECLPECQVSLFCSLGRLAQVAITINSPFISQLNLNIIHCIMYQTSSMSSCLKFRILDDDRHAKTMRNRYF